MEVKFMDSSDSFGRSRHLNADAFSLAKLSFSLENEFCRFMMFKAPAGAFFVPEYIKLYT